MPSAVIQGYLNDTTISKATREKVLNDLRTGAVNEASLESAITNKLGAKYGSAMTPADAFKSNVAKGIVGMATPKNWPNLAAKVATATAEPITKELVSQGARMTPDDVAKLAAKKAKSTQLDDQLKKLGAQTIPLEMSDDEKLKAIQEIEKRQPGSNLVANVVDEATKGLVGGGQKVYGAGIKLAETLTGIDDKTGEVLSPETRGQKFGEALIDTAGGSLEGLFAIPGAITNQVPGAKQVIGFGMEKLDEGTDAVANKYMEIAKIDPESEQGKYIKKGMSILGQLLVVKATENTGAEGVRQKGMAEARTGIDEALKTGNVEAAKAHLSTYENLVAQKPTISGNIGNTVTEGAGALLKPVIQGGGAIAKTALKAGVRAGEVVAGKAGETAGMAGTAIASRIAGVEPGTIKVGFENPGAIAEAAKVGEQGMREKTFGMVKKPLDIKAAELEKQVTSGRTNILDAAKGAIDQKIADLSETGSNYKSVRESGEHVNMADVRGNSWFENYLTDKGMEIEGGKVKATKGSMVRSGPEIARIQNLYDLYGKYTDLAPSEFLNFRKDVGELSRFGEGITTDMANFSKGLYAKLNEKGRPQLTGLEALDAQFSPLKQSLKDAKKLFYDKNGNLKPDAFEKLDKGLLKDNPSMLAALKQVVPNFDTFLDNIEGYKAGLAELKAIKSTLYDSSGNLKDNAISLVNNLLNKGKEGKLSKIQEALPNFNIEEFAKQVKLTKALEDIRVSKGNKIGAYGKAIFGGQGSMVGMLAGGPAGGIVGAGVGFILSSIIGHPNVVMSVVESFGRLKNLSKGIIDSIKGKMEDGTPLKGQEAKIVEEALQSANPKTLLQMAQVAEAHSAARAEFLNPKLLTDPEKTPLKTSEYAILTAENPGAKKMSAKANEARNAKLEKELRDMGYEPLPVEGHYGNKENSFIVPNMKTDVAIQIGNKYGQESIMAPKGLVFGDGSYHPADLTKINFDGAQTDFYSKVNAGGKEVKFSIPVDFNTKLSATGEVISKAEKVVEPAVSTGTAGETPVVRFQETVTKSSAKPALELKVTKNEGDSQYFDLHSEGKKVGELETWKNGYGPDDLHIQFIGLDEAARGKGFAQEAVRQVLEKNPGAKTISAEVTNGVAYKALKKALGEPIERGNDVMSLTEKELLESIPEKAVYNGAELDSTRRAFVRWDRPEIQAEAKPNLEASSSGTGQSAGQAKITDVSQFDKAVGLSKKNTGIEMKAFERVVKEQDSILATYKEKYGKVINTDDFKPFFKDDGYVGSNSQVVQEPSSYLSKRAFSEELKNPEPFFVSTGGGSGAGKSSALRGLKKYNEITKKAAVVLDSNFSSMKTAAKKMQEAADAGKKFVEFYVYREPTDAFLNGVIYRMKNNVEEGGRLVPAKVVANNTIGAFEVAKALHSEGHEVYFVDNSFGRGKAKLSTPDKISAKANFPTREELTAKLNAIAQKLYDTKDAKGKRGITKAQLRGFTE